MRSGFFREQEHYTMYQIQIRLQAKQEEIRKLMKTLQTYGVVKADKKGRPGKELLTDLDSALQEEMGEAGWTDYVFDFVGVIMVSDFVLKCYPKYIVSSEEPVKELKQVLKVLRRYHEERRNRRQDQQEIMLYQDGAGNTYNYLSMYLWLLEEYAVCGLYRKDQEIEEINGDGEILWERTIETGAAIFSEGRPCYIEMKTRRRMDDEEDYITRLHAWILTHCSEELLQTGLSELFDIGIVRLSEETQEHFGSQEEILRHLQQELAVQYESRKQELLKALSRLIREEESDRQDRGICFYGTSSFYTIWEWVCATVLSSVLREPLSGLCRNGWKIKSADPSVRLIDLIEKPLWSRRTEEPGVAAAHTWIPDLISVYSCGSKTCFGIFDAKYYHLEINEHCVSGQPGVEDLAKQYLYQLAFQQWAEKLGYTYIQNGFLCPAEEHVNEWDRLLEENQNGSQKNLDECGLWFYGAARIPMLQKMTDCGEQQILIWKLPAAAIFEQYLSRKKLEPLHQYFGCGKPLNRKKEVL